MSKIFGFFLVACFLVGSVDVAHSKTIASCTALCTNESSGSNVSQSMFMAVTGLGATLDSAVKRMIAKCGPYKVSGGLWFISTGGASVLSPESRVTMSDIEAMNVAAKEFVGRSCDMLTL